MLSSSAAERPLEFVLPPVLPPVELLPPDPPEAEPEPEPEPEPPLEFDESELEPDEPEPPGFPDCCVSWPFCCSALFTTA